MLNNLFKGSITHLQTLQISMKFLLHIAFSHYKNNVQVLEFIAFQLIRKINVTHIFFSSVW